MKYKQGWAVAVCRIFRPATRPFAVTPLRSVTSICRLEAWLFSNRTAQPGLTQRLLQHVPITQAAASNSAGLRLQLQFSYPIHNLLLVQGASLKPTYPSTSGHKGDFPGHHVTFSFKPQCKRAACFRFRSRYLIAIAAQTIYIACYNTQKRSAIFQQAALAAGNKPKLIFFWKVHNHHLHSQAERYFCLKNGGMTTERYGHTPTCSKYNLAFTVPGDQRPPQPRRTLCRCWSSRI